MSPGSCSESPRGRSTNSRWLEISWKGPSFNSNKRTLRTIFPRLSVLTVVSCGRIESTLEPLLLDIEPSRIVAVIFDAGGALAVAWKDAGQKNSEHLRVSRCSLQFLRNS